MGSRNYENLAAKLFCAGAILLFGFLFFRYAFFALFPFLIAYGIASVVRRLSAILARRFRLSPKVCAVALLVLFSFVFVWFLFRIGERLAREAGRLSDLLLSSDGQEIREALSSLPIVRRIGESAIGGALRDALRGGIETLGNRLLESASALAGKVVGGLSSTFVFLVVTIVATGYLATDDGTIRRRAERVLPPSLRTAWTRTRGKIGGAFRRYARAYLSLYFLTAAELFLGLLLLRVDTAALLSLLIAFIDILPIFGTGTVLLPWAAVELLLKNYPRAIGLLVLYGVITLVRQFAEPRIVGKSMGIHPFFTLLALTLGYRFFGIGGLVFSPIVVFLLASMGEDEKKDDPSP